MSNIIPFFRYNYWFWNYCYDLLEPETQCRAKEGDFVFLVDGVLFLISEPYGMANLVAQRIAPSIHKTPIIKHIYELVLWLSDLSVKYIQFHGRASRYKALFQRLFKSTLVSGEPCILQFGKEVESEDSFVVKICPTSVNFCKSQLSNTSYSRVVISK